jgi:predicted DsbA family dithiol-disulfide isomerase
MNIDVFHDTACPWCRIGKRHLALTLQQWDGEPATVQYRTFFLNEGIPPEGYDFRSYMLAKSNHRVPLEQFFDGPRQAGAAVGLTFNFEQITRAPNTLLSHRLIALAPDGQRDAIVDTIYTAYFEQGLDIGDLDVLAHIAAAHGLDADTIGEQLRGDAARDQVIAEAHWAQQHGISGVPFFIIDNRYALSGAQPPQVILRALQHAATQRQEVE